MIAIEDYLKDPETLENLNFKFYNFPDYCSLESVKLCIPNLNNKDILQYAARAQGYEMDKWYLYSRRMPRIVDEKYVTRIDDALCVPTNYNFYHLLVDSLPRLYGTFQERQDVVVTKTWLDNYKGPFDLIKDWVNVNHWHFIELPESYRKNPVNCAPNRIIGKNLRFYGNDTPHIGKAHKYGKLLAIAFWQKWFREHYVQQPQTRKIFLVRTPGKKYAQEDLYTTNERCCNQQEIYSVLKEYGFEWVDPYDYKFEELAKIVNASKTIVGTHGANLTNILFAQPNTNFIHLCNSSGTEKYFKLLAMGLRFNYAACYGKDLHSEELVTNNWSLFRIDLQEFLDKLENFNE